MTRYGAAVAPRAMPLQIPGTVSRLTDGRRTALLLSCQDGFCPVEGREMRPLQQPLGSCKLLTFAKLP
jgi:hypothetical protein